MQRKPDYSKGAFYVGILAVVAMVLATGVIISSYPEPQAPEGINYSIISEMINAGQDGLTSDEVADLIKTNGEGVYILSDSKAAKVWDFVEDEDKDFVEMFATLVEIDEDYLNIKVIDRKDTEVSAATENDKDDENYDVAVFYKIKYKDIDEDDYDYAYILVETQYDEGDLDEDEVVITEVGRDFEF